MKAFNQVLVAFVAVLAVVSVNHAQAADDMPTAATPTYEVTGSTAASYTHTTSGGQGSHNWNVAGGVGYFFNSMYELDGTVGFTDTSALGNETRNFSVLVGPTFNFMGAPENAVFVTLNAGVSLTGGGNNSPNFAQFAYLAGVGKRIEIVKHVTWKPELTFNGTLSNTNSGIKQNASTGFAIIPLQFAFLF
jgi:hypothetical protein